MLENGQSGVTSASWKKYYFHINYKNTKQSFM